MNKSKVQFLAVCLLLAPFFIVNANAQPSERRYVLLGPNTNDSEAEQYAERYHAMVLFTHDHGPIASLVVNGITGLVGPSRFMKDVMQEFRKTSNTEGEWVYIIPQRAERFLLVTLRNMGAGEVENCKGKIILLNPSSNEALEKEVRRVFSGDFAVLYAENENVP